MWMTFRIINMYNDDIIPLLKKHPSKHGTTIFKTNYDYVYNIYNYIYSPDVISNPSLGFFDLRFLFLRVDFDSPTSSKYCEKKWIINFVTWMYNPSNYLP